MTPEVPMERAGFQPVVFAKDQPEYLPLPANYKYPYTETQWKLSWRERVKLMLSGRLHLVVMNFDKPLQPVRVSVLRPRDTEL